MYLSIIQQFQLISSLLSKRGKLAGLQFCQLSLYVVRLPYLPHTMVHSYTLKAMFYSVGSMIISVFQDV